MSNRAVFLRPLLDPYNHSHPFPWWNGGWQTSFNRLLSSPAWQAPRKLRLRHAQQEGQMEKELLEANITYHDNSRISKPHGSLGKAQMQQDAIEKFWQTWENMSLVQLYFGPPLHESCKNETVMAANIWHIIFCTSCRSRCSLNDSMAHLRQAAIPISWPSPPE